MSHYATYIAQALATEGGHLQLGRGGFTLHFENSRLSGYDCDTVKAEAIAAGLPVYDSRDVEFGAVAKLACGGPMIAVGRSPDPKPWKDAYEALECAQILFMVIYGGRIRRQATDPATELGMLEKITALVPSQTRRSEESLRLQQFSTPLPLAFVAAHAAGLSSEDLVLEPSAGTGFLACFAKIAGAGLVLNELAEDRAHLLAEIFGQPVSRHDAASIHDRLEPSLSPSVVLMNPPFSAAPNVAGRFRAATMQHVRSALARLSAGGRLVMISGSNFAPGSSQWGDFFRSIEDRATIRFSCAISGRIYAAHGTTFETRLTVIDKVTGDEVPASLHTEPAESCRELLWRVAAAIPPRLLASAAPVSLRPAQPTGAIASLREKARAQARAAAAEAARHPLDDRHRRARLRAPHRRG